MYDVEEKKPDHGQFPQMGPSGFQGRGLNERGFLSWRGGLNTGSDNFSVQAVTPNVMASTRCRAAACPLTWQNVAPRVFRGFAVGG